MSLFTTDIPAVCNTSSGSHVYSDPVSTMTEETSKDGRSRVRTWISQSTEKVPIACPGKNYTGAERLRQVRNSPTLVTLRLAAPAARA